MTLTPFFRWWGRELAALLPAGLRERLRRAWSLRTGLELEPDWSQPAAAIAEEVQRALGAPNVFHDRKVALRVPERSVLRRTLALPLAAERNLAAVLELEIDRHTPFKAAAVYYTFSPLRRDAAARKLHVALTVVPRRGVEAVIERLRAEGIETTAIVAGGTRLALQEGRGGRPAPVRAWVAATLALALAGVLVAVPLLDKQAEIERREAELSGLRLEARRAESARAALAALEAEEGALLAQRRARRAALEVLLELTRRVPDGTWLSHLQLAGERLRLRGESAQPTELLGSLENSEVFQGAAFDGSVTRDARSGRERFALSASVRGGVP